jgi:hypothetical protein
MEWVKQSVDGPAAKKLRREIRMHRREKGRAGHGFTFNDIRALWMLGNDHAIVSHNSDRSWQFWWRNPDRGWHLQSWHRLLSEAQEESRKPRAITAAAKPRVPGTYVCAEWTAPYSGSAPMMVRCSSEYTTKVISEIFESLCCTTSVQSIP